MPEEARRLIETFQPYKGGHSYRAHPLWQLNELVNMDKHRIIAIGSHGFTVSFPDFPRKYNSQVQISKDSPEVRLPIELKKYLRPKPQATMEMLFGDEIYEKVAVSPKRLVEIYDFVSETVIPKFKKFFPWNVCELGPNNPIVSLRHRKRVREEASVRRRRLVQSDAIAYGSLARERRRNILLKTRHCVSILSTMLLVPPILSAW
jgi:hypothetical protein